MVLNYPFVYSIFSWCAKGIVIKFFMERNTPRVIIIVYSRRLTSMKRR
ncbi:hypothetical protein CUS_7495 [Ruminococcus albus 8]|uniref:Uncharacterized protein n=1 Tax=Ruminococcus albus 8 TaxID=246199 RepID=E9SGW7_RUMAL|nr:hypothetical protein CUS_7495 [Ruminococcus albus 8]